MGLFVQLFHTVAGWRTDKGTFSLEYLIATRISYMEIHYKVAYKY